MNAVRRSSEHFSSMGSDSIETNVLETVIMSIRPEYADRILNGSKKYEFRKKVFGRNVSTIIIYESAPVCRVVGEFRLGGILCDTPAGLWEKCSGGAGISYERYCRYFEKCSVAYALLVKDFVKYQCPKLLSAYGVCPPQSFCYLK